MQMSIFLKLDKFVRKTFKTSINIFLEALKLSPNAQGYVSGSITELLLKQKLEKLGFEVKRIREKWEGKKHPNHHGDFYFRCPNEKFWFVLESKGIKSNSEKWHRLYNYKNLKSFLISNSELISWIDQSKPIESQVEAWLKINLPDLNPYTLDLYDYEEIQKYTLPQKETPKSKAIKHLKKLPREKIQELINERLNYVMTKVLVLETHFVSGTSGSSERTQATPRKDEFNLISVDIFLRYNKHKFLYANPNDLDSSGDDPNHLQQNYIMGFVFPQKDGTYKLDISGEWNEDFIEAFKTLKKKDAIKESDMQVDGRNP